MTYYPYVDRFEVNRTLPDAGRDRSEVLEELRAMATEEDATWENGKISGSYYCGDQDHYAFMSEAFGMFAHVNALRARRLPERHQVRGRDHLDGSGPVQRRGGQ